MTGRAVRSSCAVITPPPPNVIGRGGECGGIGPPESLSQALNSKIVAASSGSLPLLSNRGNRIPLRFMMVPFAWCVELSPGSRICWRRRVAAGSDV